MTEIPRRLILIGFAVVLAIIVGAIAVNLWNGLRTGAAETRVEREAGRAATETGQDAVSTLGGASQREKTIDELTRENGDAIHNAHGASAPVDPAVDAAGRASVCRRAAYRRHPDCVQFTPAR